MLAIASSIDRPIEETKMKRFALALSIALISAAVALGQQPVGTLPEPPAPQRESARMISPGETPEMWFYEQERRRTEDPETIVRANAQEKATQRRARLAALAWFGLSNSRPTASPDPIHGPYSPRWISNGYQPSEWIGITGGNTIILEAARGTTRY
jgi:hypothetical protein